MELPVNKSIKFNYQFHMIYNIGVPGLLITVQAPIWECKMTKVHKLIVCTSNGGMWPQLFQIPCRGQSHLWQGI